MTPDSLSTQLTGLDALAAPRPFPLGSIVSVAEPFAMAAGIPRKPGQLMEYEAGVGTTLAVVAIDGLLLRVPVSEVERVDEPPVCGCRTSYFRDGKRSVVHECSLASGPAPALEKGQ